MKKKLVVILLAVATIVCSMTAMVSAATISGRVDGIIDYEALKSINTDMTYRDLAYLVLDKCSAEFKTSRESDYSVPFVVFCNEKFKTEAYDNKTVIYVYDQLTGHPENYEEQKDKDWISVLDRKLDKDTIIKYGYYLSYHVDAHGIVDNCSVTEAYINGTTQIWDEYQHRYNEEFYDAITSAYKVSIAKIPREVIDQNTAYAAMRIFLNVGTVETVINGTAEDAIKSTETKQSGVPTSDSSDLALFGIMGLLALCGAGFVYKRREN